MNKKIFFSKLEKKVKKCIKCPLHKKRINAVFGNGPISSEILIIGLSPGKEEDIQGKPFVGRAGKLLDNLLIKANIDRKKVFLTNLVKCHPPKNREPKKTEIETCIDYLYTQLDVIRPKIIITLGRLPMEYLYKYFDLKLDKISKMHGKIKDVVYKNNKIKLICAYHPAYGLYKPQKRKILEKDFQKIKIKK